MALYEINEQQIQTIFELDSSGTLYQKLLTLFQTEVSELLYELRRTMTDKNNTQCAKISHAIKSSSLNIGAASLAKKCEIAEKNFHENKEQNHNLVVELTECFEYIVPMLKEYSESIKKG